MEPHKVLNLPARGFTVEQLRRNYKLLAKQLHPDKRPASMSNEDANAMFQLFTEAYRQLLEQVEAENSFNMPFDQMRQKARDSHTNISKPINPKTQERFDIQYFNQLFNDNRLGDPVYDYGYETWMNRTDPGNEHAGQVIVAPKYDLQPCELSKKTSTPFTELGVISVTDYSGKVGASERLVYTDYKLAHSTRKLADDKELSNFREDARPELSSLDTLRAHRSQPFNAKTDAELQREEEMRRARQAEDEQRRANLHQADRLTALTHERLTRLMLGR